MISKIVPIGSALLSWQCACTLLSTIGEEASMCSWQSLASCACVMGAFLVPSTVRAQPAAHSFDEFQRSAKIGQTVVVTDVRGAEVRGRLADVSVGELVLLVPDRLVFGAQDVALSGRRVGRLGSG